MRMRMRAHVHVHARLPEATQKHGYATRAQDGRPVRLDGRQRPCKWSVVSGKW